MSFWEKWGREAVTHVEVRPGTTIFSYCFAADRTKAAMTVLDWPQEQQRAFLAKRLRRELDAARWGADFATWDPAEVEAEALRLLLVGFRAGLTDAGR